MSRYITARIRRVPRERFDGVAVAMQAFFYVCGILWAVFILAILVGFLLLWASSKGAT